MLAALAAFVLSQTPDHQGLLDPKALIARMTVLSPAAIDEKEVAYLHEVEQYIAKSPAMPVGVAALRWLDLRAEGKALPRHPPQNGPPPIGSFQTVFAALPRPEAWPAIAARVDKLPPSAERDDLQLLFARLRGDDREVLRLIRNFASPNSHHGEFSFVWPDAEARLHDIDEEVEEAKKLQGPMPDIASLWGETRAKDVLAPIYANTTGGRIDDPATRSLAEQVVLSELDKVKTPPWDLAAGIEDAPYLEALAKRFDPATMDDAYPNGARDIYFADLLIKGRVDQAAELLKTSKSVRDLLSFGPWADSSPQRLLAKAFPSIEQLMKRLPDRDMWSLYVYGAEASGHAQEAVTRLRTALEDPATQGDVKSQLFLLLGDLYKSLGRIDAAMSNFWMQWRLESDNNGYSLQSLSQLADAIGDRRTRAETDAEFAKLPNFSRDLSGFRRLLDDGQFRKAEDELAAFLDKVFRGPSAYVGNQAGYDACRLYYSADRPKDVVEIIRDYPYWSSSDLGSLAYITDNTSLYYPDSPEPRLGFYAAWAFARTGRTSLAAQVLERLLSDVDGTDETYRLLNQIEGAQALKFYDKLCFAYLDSIRPWIWKAELLRQLGRLKEAEACVREAIQNDPLISVPDIHHQMSAYGVLARILSQEGDARGSAECAGRVKAADLAARADTLKRVGLFPQASALYLRSIAASPSDYVVEEDLAQCLERMGRLDEAVPHHLRAFTLMPRGIGRTTDIHDRDPNMFINPDVLALGEPILNNLAAGASATAAEACVRGYYENLAGRPWQAVSFYKKAVAIDPKFNTAWLNLLDLGRKGFLSREETQAIAYRVVALGPRHEYRYTWGEEYLSDLASAYRVWESEASSMLSPSDRPLFRLHHGRSFDPFGTLPPWGFLREGIVQPLGEALKQARDVSDIVQDLTEMDQRW